MAERLNRVLLVVPHLSTGGLPAYVQRFVEFFTSDEAGEQRCDVAVAEWRHTAPDFVVHFNRVKSLCPLFQVHGDGERLLATIREFKPDVVHFQEFPPYDEAFRDGDVLRRVLQLRAAFSVVVTSHGSFTDWCHGFWADAVVAVSPWQEAMVRQALPQMSVGTWMCPIVKRKISAEERASAQEALGFERWAVPKAHILQVGLWNANKNQGFTLEVARRCPEFLFHFVGNHATNFQEYWEKLEIPPNAVVWEERADVDVFLKACDALMHPSHYELNPVSIREALSVSMPVFTRRLPVYEGLYDDEPLMRWIDIGQFQAQGENGDWHNVVDESGVERVVGMLRGEFE